MNQYGMEKAEIKALCEADDKLQWWAMVLFAEISDSMNCSEQEVDKARMSVVRAKVKEFPHLVIQRQLEKIKEAEKEKTANDAINPLPENSED